MIFPACYSSRWVLVMACCTILPVCSEEVGSQLASIRPALIEQALIEPVLIEQALIQVVLIRPAWTQRAKTQLAW